MSGGSFDYLYGKSPEDLILCQNLLEKMAEALDRLPDTADVARETREVSLIFRGALARVEVRQRRLKAIWKAVEWVDCGDWGPDAITEALAAYREEQP